MNKGDTFLPKRTIIEAFDKTSYFVHPPEIGFGSGTRPPLMEPTPGPGPGAYPIKTTLGKLPESHITSPCAFTLKGREKFGDPNAKALSKTSASEPGPAAYDITDKFVSGALPRLDEAPCPAAIQPIQPSSLFQVPIHANRGSPRPCHSGTRRRWGRGRAATSTFTAWASKCCPRGTRRWCLGSPRRRGRAWKSRAGRRWGQGNTSKAPRHASLR